MSSPVIQVQVRLGSTRLPGKIFYSLSNRLVIERVYNQANQSNISEKIVFAIGDQPENAAIIEWCERNNMDYVQGPENDLLERHVRTADRFNSDPIVRITGDCPFIPTEEIERTFQTHSSNDALYTTNYAEEMPVGTAVDVIDRDVLEELQHLGDTHPVRRLRENPEQWDVSFTQGDKWMKFPDAHIAVDTPADYWTLTDAVQAVGDNPLDILRWLTENNR